MALKAGEIEVVGRDEELAAVRGFLDAVERLPAALVIGGEAGIGKTTLWCAGIASAEGRGYRVLSTRPAQAESRTGFSACRLATAATAASAQPAWLCGNMRDSPATAKWRQRRRGSRRDTPASLRSGEAQLPKSGATAAGAGAR